MKFKRSVSQESSRENVSKSSVLVEWPRTNTTHIGQESLIGSSRIFNAKLNLHWLPLAIGNTIGNQPSLITVSYW